VTLADNEFQEKLRMRKKSSSQSGGVSQGDHATGNITITGDIGGDFVAGDKHVHEALAPTISALHQLPPPPADFTGREADLDELLAALEDASLTISGLQGMGGIGKTALALKLADKIKDRYPDGQFYLDLLGVSPQPLTPAKAMEHVIHAYHPGARLPESEAELRGIYLSVLHDQRALLLMDNVRDKKQVEPLIPPAGCRLLVTSRQYFALPGLFAKSLDCLPQTDACKLLLIIAPRIGELAEEVARLCGYLPFALRLAAGAIAEHRSIKPADYTRQLADAQKRLKLIEASLSLSYKILSEEQQKRWRMLAVFPDSFDEAAAAAAWETEVEKTQAALDELLSFNLMEWNDTEGRYRLHDLARVFAESRLNEAEREGSRRLHARHYQIVLTAANDLYLRGGDEVLRGLGLFDLERTNIEAGHAWAAEQAGNDEAAVKLCITYPDAGAYVLELRQHPLELIQWFETMLAAARALNRRDAEGKSLGNLGIAYRKLGEIRRAIKFYEQSLAITRETGDRGGEGKALGNLGIAYADLGKTRRAIEFFEQSLAIARETGDRRSEGIVLDNLGNAYANLGETRRAIEFFEQDLAITRETGDRRGEGKALGNLGNAYDDLGETRRAIEFFEQYLAITRETGDRRGEGTSLGNLGIAYRKLGEIHRAIEFFEQDLAITRETGDRRGEGTSLGNLGNAYAHLGETRRAIEFYEQSLAITRETSDRRGEGTLLGNLGIAYKNMGKIRRAIEFFEQSLAIARETGNRRGEGASLDKLGNAYDDLGEARRAIEFFEQSLAIARETSNRRGEGQALGSLGIAYMNMGKIRRAIEFFEQGLAIARETSNRRGEGQALGNLGIAYKNMGETRRAIEFYEQDLAIARETGNRRREGQSLWNMALALDNSEDRAQAIAGAEAALVIFEQIESPHAEMVRNQMAKWRAAEAADQT
jgi:tetratricopeptide (TPR) repeat protein